MFGLGSAGAVKFIGDDIWFVICMMGAAAFSFSFVLVPLSAALQTESNPDNRAKAIGGSNAMNAIAMVLGGYFVAGLQNSGVELSTIYFVIGTGTVVFGTWLAGQADNKPSDQPN